MIGLTTGIQIIALTIIDETESMREQGIVKP